MNVFAPLATCALHASYAPASQASEYAKQSAVPAAPGTFGAKQTQMIQNDDDAAIVWASVA